nr:MAG TPA: hypothetical protein [Caudoviricetes sp.]
MSKGRHSKLCPFSLKGWRGSDEKKKIPILSRF